MLYQLQYLRAVAVLAVFYFHLVEVLSDNGVKLDGVLHEVGPVGVDIFFVISGFIMARIACQREIRPAGFMIARLRRIAPNYWTATLLLFLLALYFPHLLTTTTADPIQLLHSLFFVPNGQGSVSNAPTLVVGWTLNYEMFFYFLVAVFAGFLRDTKLYFVVFGLMLLALAGCVGQTDNGYWEFYTDPIILEFGFGVMVHHIWTKQNRTSFPEVFVLLIISMIILIVMSAPYHLSDMRPLVWGIPSAIIVYAVMQFDFGAGTLFQKIGDWSYEIYIWHVFAIAASVKLLHNALTFSFQEIIAGVFCLGLFFGGLALIAAWITKQSAPIDGKK